MLECIIRCCVRLTARCCRACSGERIEAQLSAVVCPGRWPTGNGLLLLSHYHSGIYVGRQPWRDTLRFLERLLAQVCEACYENA